jgi:hypothetical protein
MSLTTRNNTPILDINSANAVSPYLISYDESDTAYIFPTDRDINCHVFFIPDYRTFVNADNVYNIQILTRPPVSVKGDANVQKTICAILSAFFQDNTKIVAYICDDQDTFEDRHKPQFPYQTIRNRLFDIWFTQANKDGLYEKMQATFDRNGEPIHIAVICRCDCPTREKLRKEFDLFVENLTADVEK